MIAQLTAIVASFASGKRMKTADFMPKWEPQKPKSWKTMLETARMITAGMGGKTK